MIAILETILGFIMVLIAIWAYILIFLTLKDERDGDRMRKTLYGTLTQDEELNENEKAMLYIKECATLVGLNVVEGETAFSIIFMAEIMRRLREKVGE